MFGKPRKHKPSKQSSLDPQEYLSGYPYFVGSFFPFLDKDNSSSISNKIFLTAFFLFSFEAICMLKISSENFDFLLGANPYLSKLSGSIFERVLVYKIISSVLVQRLNFLGFDIKDVRSKKDSEILQKGVLILVVLGGAVVSIVSSGIIPFFVQIVGAIVFELLCEVCDKKGYGQSILWAILLTTADSILGPLFFIEDSFLNLSFAFIRGEESLQNFLFIAENSLIKIVSSILLLVGFFYLDSYYYPLSIVAKHVRGVRQVQKIDFVIGGSLPMIMFFGVCFFYSIFIPSVISAKGTYYGDMFSGAFGFDIFEIIKPIFGLIEFTRVFNHSIIGLVIRFSVSGSLLFITIYWSSIEQAQVLGLTPAQFIKEINRAGMKLALCREGLSQQEDSLRTKIADLAFSSAIYLTSLILFSVTLGVLGGSPLSYFVLVWLSRMSLSTMKEDFPELKDI